MKYIIGNWKSNKNTVQVQDWVKFFAAEFPKLHTADLTVVLCPSFLHIPIVRDSLVNLLNSTNFALGAQTLSSYPNGQYTGAVSALMLTEFVQYVILGHAERRRFFGETDVAVTNEAIQAVENTMTPIIAVDQYNWSTQLAQLDDNQLAKSLVMFEPPEAISSGDSGHAADLNEVKQAIQLIKSKYSVRGVLYGGSVDSHNVQLYLREKEIDGVVPGAASLDVKEFLRLIQNAAAVL